jgi:hypothetical protein
MVQYIIHGLTSDLLWRNLEPFRQIVGAKGATKYDFQLDLTKPKSKLLACLFHSLLHFGQTGPMRYGKERFDYFSALERINPNVLRTFLLPYQVHFGFSRNGEIILDGAAAGYTSVIPLTRAGLDAYVDNGTHSQFELSGSHIAPKGEKSEYIYVQAAARPYYLTVDSHTSGEVSRVADIDDPLPVNKIAFELKRHIQQFLPVNWDRAHILFEVYNEKLIEDFRQKFDVTDDTQLSFKKVSKDGRDLLGFRIGDSNALLNWLRP